MRGHRSQGPGHFTTWAVLFELGLGGLALLLGVVTGPWPWQDLLGWNSSSFLVPASAGIVVACALMGSVVTLDRWPIGPFRELQQTVRQYVVPLFHGTSVAQLATISVAAGIGEEMLFRGYIQAALTAWLGQIPGAAWWALVAASVLFGLCHWLSRSYAVVAAGMGLVLGALFLATENLIAPMVAHGLYDFLALVYLTRTSPPTRPPAAASDAAADRCEDGEQASEDPHNAAP